MKLWDYVKAALPQKAPYYGYCHGDMHSGNIFFVEDQPQIFDFDCMGYGYRAYDICIFAWSTTFRQQNFIETQSWQMYLEGYSSIRKLGEDELRCIPAFAALRCLWLMGLHLDGTAYKNSWSVFNDGYFNNNMTLFKLWYYRVFPDLNPV